jgi:crossover junction endodeoxyribonuclease RuvC
MGIDPGIAVMGYGVIEEANGALTTIDYGCLSTSPRQATPERLRFLYSELMALIERYQPSEVAVESFVARNLKAALSVGQARGVAILAAANKGLPVYEYTPLEVKRNISGYGRSDKSQVQKMVGIQLGLESVPEPDDAADALAVAICHIGRARLLQLEKTSQ